MTTEKISKTPKTPDNPAPEKLTISCGIVTMSLTLALAPWFLTPEEIQKAAAEGSELHEEAMKKRKDT